MGKLLKITFLSIFLIFAGGGLSTAVAQGPGDGGPCYGTDIPPDTECPLDGGLSFLLAVGVGYGLKKFRAEEKEKPDGEKI